MRRVIAMVVGHPPEEREKIAAALRSHVEGREGTLPVPRLP